MLEARFFAATYLEVVEPYGPQAAAVLREYGDAASGVEGDVRLEVMRRVERPNQFILLAGAASETAIEAHRASRPFTQLSERLAPLLAAPPDIRQHRCLTIGAAGETRRNSLTAVTHVDVVPQHKDEAVASLERLAIDSRGHTDNVRFDVWQQVNRPNHFTVVETWSARRTFYAHAAAEETRYFRSQLGPMSGALYDERLYKRMARTSP